MARTQKLLNKTGKIKRYVRIKLQPYIIKLLEDIAVYFRDKYNINLTRTNVISLLVQTTPEEVLRSAALSTHRVIDVQQRRFVEVHHYTIERLCLTGYCAPHAIIEVLVVYYHRLIKQNRLQLVLQSTSSQDTTQVH
jgi:hypothetical protein